MIAKHTTPLLAYTLYAVLFSLPAIAAESASPSTPKTEEKAKIEEKIGTPEEELALADKYFGDEDVRAAARHLRFAAEGNNLTAQNRLGEFMNGSDDYEEAFGWFLTAAFQGDAAAQFNLGQQYANGQGTDPSPEKALYWVKKSAEQNHLYAVELLATLYGGKLDSESSSLATIKNGFGITPNREQADFWKAKLPELQKAEARRVKKLENEAAKRNEAAKKAAAAKTDTKQTNK